MSQEDTSTNEQSASSAQGKTTDTESDYDGEHSIIEHMESNNDTTNIDHLNKLIKLYTGEHYHSNDFIHPCNGECEGAFLAREIIRLRGLIPTHVIINEANLISIGLIDFPLDPDWKILKISDVRE